MANGGRRPGSGRKSYAGELKTIEVLQKCQDICLEFLNNPNIPAEKKIDVASRLFHKAIPQDVNLGGQQDNALVISWKAASA